MQETSSIKVYERSAAYRRGWVSGFYDCRRGDDGCSDNGRGCVAEAGDECAGYIAGRSFRMTAIPRQHAEEEAVPQAA